MTDKLTDNVYAVKMSHFSSKLNTQKHEKHERRKVGKDFSDVIQSVKSKEKTNNKMKRLKNG